MGWIDFFLQIDNPYGINSMGWIDFFLQIDNPYGINDIVEQYCSIKR
ncbi:MAG: hypothetical protein K9N06_05485 [Candidatus Cloacimonetes bacterium]|nr:hypothetical protein [Candidatus Cloacimonadota bacterium]